MTDARLSLLMGLCAIAWLIPSFAVWAWLGPFAGALWSCAAFYVGGMALLILEKKEQK